MRKKSMEQFKEMLAIAKEKNQSLTGEYAQTVVALTENERLFTLSLCNALDIQSHETDLFLESLAENGNSPVTHLVCLWKVGDVDLPSMALRKRLLEQNPESGNARILLFGESGYMQRSLASTMP